jgi:hypothetical protein
MGNEWLRSHRKVGVYVEHNVWYFVKCRTHEAVQYRSTKPSVLPSRPFRLPNHVTFSPDGHDKNVVTERLAPFFGTRYTELTHSLCGTRYIIPALNNFITSYPHSSGWCTFIIRCHRACVKTGGALEIWELAHSSCYNLRFCHADMESCTEDELSKLAPGCQVCVRLLDEPM